MGYLPYQIEKCGFKVRHIAGLLGLILTVLGQGCSDVDFSQSQSQSSQNEPTPTVVLKIKDVFVRTELNTPVDFVVEVESDDGSVKNLTAAADGSAGAATQFGQILIVDAGQLRARYLPNMNFRGDDQGYVYLKDKSGAAVRGLVRIQVANPLAALQPGLAVRATGCVMCHANVSANVITDFGFGGDGQGRNYFFGQGVSSHTPRSGAVYGDHAENWKTANLVGNVYVPKANLTGPLSNLGASTLAGYLTRTLSESPSPSSRAAQVIEKDSIYIGAPTAERIRAVTGLQSGMPWKFIPESRTTLPLSGLKVSANGQYVTNEPENPLVCSGDLAIEGTVFFRKLKLVTTKGCRIYATGSIFIEGPINHLSGQVDSNLQIVSARAITLGIGRNTCNTAYPWYNGQPVEARFRDFWTIPGYMTRADGGSAGQNMGTILSESQKIEALPDSACTVEGRNIGFERLILNAPIVQSRYLGNFRGAIIAEIAIMSLGAFKYEFDPVFRRVPILPLLKTSDYLDIQ